MGTRYVFLGRGSRKGTQAALVSEALGVAIISTGSIFRAAISGATKIGKQIAQFVNAAFWSPIN